MYKKTNITEMNVQGFNFEGPYLLDANFNEVPAVYLISDQNNKPIDVGQTDNLKNRIPNHERTNCWLRSANGQVHVYCLVDSSEENRENIERNIRNSHSFSCGVF